MPQVIGQGKKDQQKNAYRSMWVCSVRKIEKHNGHDKMLTD